MFLQTSRSKRKPGFLMKMSEVEHDVTCHRSFESWVLKFKTLKHPMAYDSDPSHGGRVNSP